MLKQPPLAALALALALPAFAQTATEPAETPAEDAAEAEVIPLRPGTEEGDPVSMSDGLAECAAIMATASGVSTSFVERDNLAAASGEWMDAAARAAGAEGRGFSDDILTQKATAWAGKIGKVRSLEENHGDWIAYCSHIGQENGLDTRLIDERLPS